MDEKLRALFMSLRATLIEQLVAIEDALGIAYDKSALYARREKDAGNGRQRQRREEA